MKWLVVAVAVLVACTRPHGATTPSARAVPTPSIQVGACGEPTRDGVMSDRPKLEHAVASLAPADPWMAGECQEHGIPVWSAPAAASLHRMMETADIVQVHFWNSPGLYELLASDLPAMRLLVWPHIAGEHPPQVIPPQLLEFASTTGNLLMGKPFKLEAMRDALHRLFPDRRPGAAAHAQGGSMH